MANIGDYPFTGFRDNDAYQPDPPVTGPGLDVQAARREFGASVSKAIAEAAVKYRLATGLVVKDVEVTSVRHSFIGGHTDLSGRTEAYESCHASVTVHDDLG